MAREQSLSEARDAARAAAGGQESIQQLKAVRESKKSARDDYHYQDRYGTIMTDEQYAANNANQDAFDAEIAAGRAKVKAAQGTLNASKAESEALIQQQAQDAYSATYQEYNDTLNEINSVNLGDKPNTSSIPDWDTWSQTNTNTVSVDGHNYLLTKDSFNNFVGKVHDYNANNEQDIGMWSTDTGVNIDTQGYGAEWHEQLGTAEQELKNAFNNEVAKAEAAIAAGQSEYEAAQQQLADAKNALEVSVNSSYETIGSQVTTAQMELQGQVAKAEATLASATTSLDGSVKARDVALQGIKDQYSERIDDMKEGAMSLTKTGGRKT